MSEEIRTRIDEAGNKEKLEAIGRELEPPVELDRRKTMDILRAELHAHLDEYGQDEAGDTGVSDEAGSDEAGDAGDPEPAQEPEPTADTPKYKGRLLQNTRTKRLFPYTAALAAKRNMREV